MNVLILNLPDPPGMIINRDFAGGFGSAFQRSNNQLYDVFPPIFDAYAASILEAEGIEVKVLDLREKPIGNVHLADRVAKVMPDVVIGRISLPSLESDLAFLVAVREDFPEALYVGWGSTCKVLPEEVLRRGSLDLVIRTGELDVAILGMIDAFMMENCGEHIRRKANVSFKEGEKIVHNPTDPPDKTLDSIPIPACHLLDMKKYVAVESHYVPGGSDNVTIPFFTVGGSRGCSFNCMYCPYPVIFGPWRGRSPGKIVDEVEYLVDNNNIRAFWFYDQTFSMDVKRSIEICDEIIGRKLNVYWACETRADKMPPVLIKKLRRAGCTRVQLGIETGDPELLSKIGKPRCKLEVFERNIQNLKGEGILTELNFIVGLPGETWRSIFRTAKFIRKVRPDMFSISVVTPYPGTFLYEMADKEGYLLTKDWERYSLSNPVMSLPGFSSRSMKMAKLYLYYQTRLAERVGKILELFKGETL